MQLSSLNSLKPGVKLIMKILLEQRRQAMLQLHLSYQQFYCILRCDLYEMFYGRYNSNNNETQQSTKNVHNRPISQIPEYRPTCSTSYNAPFRKEQFKFLFWMGHCGIWNMCNLRFVTWANGNWWIETCTASILHEITEISTILCFLCGALNLDVIIWKCFSHY